jgi:periplasmic divalent cation tolerance protein
MNQIAIVYTLLPSFEVAQKLAEELVNKHLVACANTFKVESAFFWDQELQTESEVALLCKTGTSEAHDVVSYIEAMHPYSCPAILHWLVYANEAYATWVEKQLNQDV